MATCSRWHTIAGCLVNAFIKFFERALNAGFEDQPRILGNAVIVIDHFLENVVFPLHAKHFRTKLQMSGWDIPLYNDNQTSPSSDDTGNIGNRRGSSHLVLDIQSRRVPTKASTQDNQHVISFLYLQRYNEVGHIVPIDDITEPKRHEAELSQSLTLGLNQIKDHTVQAIMRL
ncbi:hypothetical protein DTO164E3_6880 [Paecilomyces variotii]|nr:hypothetical protein DTO032I3_8788 [Paecilomyces variotii]KAJ9195344.1 hypothetical protein DTO164E3_6880 [Paecilomyces variotii]KAJ9281317.1 hypothetical protein DTO021D3_1976 [Paecilomyces variotii]KAJ9344981.1 hypothetical protein DTO027B6_2687 [Paecilomyces variotii]KAJ9375509.1 hypothetical protein DTO032I4_8999 [Paecilomyces variotii]